MLMAIEVIDCKFFICEHYLFWHIAHSCGLRFQRKLICFQIKSWLRYMEAIDSQSAGKFKLKAIWSIVQRPLTDKTTYKVVAISNERLTWIHRECWLMKPKCGLTNPWQIQIRGNWIAKYTKVVDERPWPPSRVDLATTQGWIPPFAPSSKFFYF